MAPPARRRFDSTWLPFGMILGFVVGIGMGLAVVDSLWIGAVVGVLVGAGLGVLLGLRGGGDALTRDEDAEDDEYRRLHGDPRPGERR
ncbi:MULTISPECIES: hypothetical protein [Brachybacterium]|uniref:Glycine zipper family protein n=1 Tax=Brachybacterium paraconglomeratum TaxID=173362 RepID=A0A921KQP2_9MICO|nr:MULTISPECIES: hypothetical protein [Brachybacterium]MCZ4327652.1 hypothetical protein [Brachybacterium paraconglomeratum]MDV3296189.1 hypothetical protein [Brachybacterium paraconglomeratum]TDP80372.1 hypothetical protein DEU31_0807 [Brachybacterium sp. AG952]GAP79884.1 hypothetical protein Y09_2739 [Brachybacterium sp. SW0106-09]HJF49929.1 hypothetical protein [Brachybacterium paraconglomeratum]